MLNLHFLGFLIVAIIELIDAYTLLCLKSEYSGGKRAYQLRVFATLGEDWRSFPCTHMAV